MQLAQASSPRAAVAVAGSGVPEAQMSASWAEVVLKDGADGRGGSFGLKGDVAPALVLKLIHLLIDDVAGFTGSALKELDVFKHRSSDFAIAIQRGDVMVCRFDFLPTRRLCRNDVFGASWCLNPHN